MVEGCILSSVLQSNHSLAVSFSNNADNENSDIFDKSHFIPSLVGGCGCLSTCEVTDFPLVNLEDFLVGDGKRHEEISSPAIYTMKAFSKGTFH
jgi:hypothetical protein